MTARKLLAIFAHPDDETFICGGTLARYAAEGVEITLICATRGEMGRRVGIPPRLTRETMPAARSKELEEAGRILGLKEIRYLGLLDKTVEFADEAQLTNRLVQAIQDIDPDVVLTFHEKTGGHPDHCAIGKFAAAAFRQAQPMRQDRPVPMQLRFLSFGDPTPQLQRYGLRPKYRFAVDIRQHRLAKLHAFRAHRSQSEMIEWVWKADDEAVRQMGSTEYFFGAEPHEPGSVDEPARLGDLFLPGR